MGWTREISTLESNDSTVSPNYITFFANNLRYCSCGLSMLRWKVRQSACIINVATYWKCTLAVDTRYYALSINTKSWQVYSSQVRLSFSDFNASTVVDPLCSSSLCLWDREAGRMVGREYGRRAGGDEFRGVIVIQDRWRGWQTLLLFSLHLLVVEVIDGISYIIADGCGFWNCWM